MFWFQISVTCNLIVPMPAAGCTNWIIKIEKNLKNAPKQRQNGVGKKMIAKELQILAIADYLHIFPFKMYKYYLNFYSIKSIKYGNIILVICIYFIVCHCWKLEFFMSWGWIRQVKWSRERCYWLFFHPINRELLLQQKMFKNFYAQTLSCVSLFCAKNLAIFTDFCYKFY